MCPSRSSQPTAASLHPERACTPCAATPSCSCMLRRAVRPIPSPSIAAGQPHMVCIYKRALRIALCPHQRLLSASGKPPPPHLTSISATPSVPSCLTRFPSSCAGPGASPELGATPRATRPPPSPPESHRAVAVAVNFCLDVVPLPRSVSRANTLPRRRTVAHGCAPWTP
jgi:hypothetical protein